MKQVQLSRYKILVNIVTEKYYSPYDFKLSVTSTSIFTGRSTKFLREPIPAEHICTRAKEMYRHARTKIVRSFWRHYQLEIVKTV